MKKSFDLQKSNNNLPKLFLNTNGDGVFGIVYFPPEYTSYSSDDAYREIQNEVYQFDQNHPFLFLVNI
jgi:hypothetical protein